MRRGIARLPQSVSLLLSFSVRFSATQRSRQPKMAARSTRSSCHATDTEPPVPSRSAVRKMTVKELRYHLSRCKLPTTGIHHQLLQRLLDHVSSSDPNTDPQAQEKIPTTLPPTNHRTQTPVALVPAPASRNHPRWTAARLTPQGGIAPACIPVPAHTQDLGMEGVPDRRSTLINTGDHHPDTIPTTTPRSFSPGQTQTSDSVPSLSPQLLQH